MGTIQGIPVCGTGGEGVIGQSQLMEAKLCNCGCGKPSGTYVKTDRTQGQLKGAAKRFLCGHKPRKSLQERFVSKVNRNGAIPLHKPALGKCWIWEGGADRKGYGRIGLGTRKEGVAIAHRIAWLLKIGSAAPLNYDVCHKCDNPRCVRFSHLFIGTRTDNMRDCIRKGRHAAQKRAA